MRIVCFDIYSDTNVRLFCYAAELAGRRLARTDCTALAVLMVGLRSRGRDWSISLDSTLRSRKSGNFGLC